MSCVSLSHERSSGVSVCVCVCVRGWGGTHNQLVMMIGVSANVMISFDRVNFHCGAVVHIQVHTHTVSNTHQQPEVRTMANPTSSNID